MVILIKESDFLEVARQNSVKKPKEIIENILEAVSKWKEYAKGSNLEKDRTKLIGDIQEKGIKNAVL